MIVKEWLEETWKRINGYEEYEISNLGRVKSFKRDRKGKIMKPKFSGEYLAVTLCADGQQERKTIHRLVAEHFIPNPKNKPQVNHIDGNKLNNKACNLEWVDNSENLKHAHDIGIKKPSLGESNGMSKLTNHEVLAIYFLAHTGKFKLKEIANLFDTDYRNVSLIKLGKRWGHLTDVYKIINRVEELEKDNKRLRDLNYHNNLPAMKSMYEENKRYKQALERVLDFYPGVPNAEYIPIEMLFEIKNIARKALEESD